MGAQDDMIAAVNAAEAAAAALANAFVSYTSAYKSAASAVSAIQGGARGLQDVAQLEHAVGPERVAQFAHGRLLALGAERIVAQIGATPAGAEWTTWLTNQIQHHVPAAAAAVRSR